MTNNTNEINKLITQRLQRIKSDVANLPGLIQTAVTEDARLINFKQDNLVKLSIGIITDPQGSNFIPTLRFGAGDGSNSNMGYLTKDTTGLNLFYVGNYANNEITGLSIQNGKIYTTCPIEISDTLGNKLLLSVTNINSKITEADMTSTLRNTSKNLQIPSANILNGTKWDGRTTQISDSGIYTGSLIASQVNTGTLSTAAWDGTGSNYIKMQRQMIFFQEDTNTKMAMGFLPNKDNTQIPLIVLGAGDGNGSNRGYIQKDTDGLSMYYIGDKTLGEVSYLKLMKDKAILNGYEVFSTKSAIADSYIASATTWNTKLSETQMTNVLQNTSKNLQIPQENLSTTVSNKINNAYAIIDPNDMKILANKIKDASITTAAIANSAIDNTKLANLAVDAAKLANSAVTATKIANAAVGSAAIATAAIGSAHIANGVITNAHILDATIESAKIKSLTADKIVAGTLTGFTIQTASTGKRLILQSNGLASYDGSTLQGWQIDPMGSIGYFRGYTNGVEYGNISASSSSLYLLAKNNANLSLEAQGTGQITFTGPVNFTQATVTGQFTVCWG